VTVPVAGVPPITSGGLMLTADRAGAGAGGGGGCGGGGRGGGGSGGGGEPAVQPDNVAVVAFAEPSFTATRQSLGGEKDWLSILKEPEASLVPSTTPLTVIDRFGVAVPSSRSLVPLSSAREIWTAASAEDAVDNTAASTTKLSSATRAMNER